MGNPSGLKFSGNWSVSVTGSDDDFLALSLEGLPGEAPRNLGKSATI